MFCPWCGKKIDDTAIYCENCGRKISTDANCVSDEKKCVTSQKSHFLLILIVAIFVVGLGIVGIQLFYDEDVEESSNTNNSNENNEVLTSYVNETETSVQSIVEESNEEQQNYKRILASENDEKDRSYEDTVFSFSSEYDEDKGIVFGSLYITQNGRESHVITKEYLDPFILTNGTSIYYSICNNNMTATVYKYDVSSDNEEIIFSVNTEDGLSLAGYYDERIYYIVDLDPGKLCVYDLKKREKQQIAENVTHVTQNEQYFYLMPYYGDAGGTSCLNVYDASTGTENVISSNLCLMGPVEYIDDAVFYLEYTDNSDYHMFPTTIRVKKCKADGSEQTTLLESLDVTEVLEISEEFVRYEDGNGNEKVRSFTPLMFTEVFDSFPQVFTLTSGMESWQTELTVEEDGTFIGEYSDADAFETYICEFTGTFSDLQEIDEYTYSMQIESLEYAKTIGDEYEEDGLTYIVSEPAGIEAHGEYMLYLPGRSTADLPEAFLSWVWIAGDVSEKLPFYGIYNAETECGFFSDTP